MNILTITLRDQKTEETKTYSAGRFPAYLAREIMRIQAQQLEIGKIRGDIEASKKRLDEIKKAIASGAQADIDPTLTQTLTATMGAVLAAEADTYDRMMWVICETYGNKFTPDEVDHSLDRKEVFEQIEKIAAATSGIFEKN